MSHGDVSPVNVGGRRQLSKVPLLQAMISMVNLATL